MPHKPVTRPSAQTLDTAASLMEEALRLLDEENDPANVTPHLDLALSRLREFVAQIQRPSDEPSTAGFPPRDATGLLIGDVSSKMDDLGPNWSNG